MRAELPHLHSHVRSQLFPDVRCDLRADVRPYLRRDLRCHLRGNLRSDLRAHVRNVPAHLRAYCVPGNLRGNVPPHVWTELSQSRSAHMFPHVRHLPASGLSAASIRGGSRRGGYTIWDVLHLYPHGRVLPDRTAYGLPTELPCHAVLHAMPHLPDALSNNLPADVPANLRDLPADLRHVFHALRHLHTGVSKLAGPLSLCSCALPTSHDFVPGTHCILSGDSRRLSHTNRSVSDRGLSPGRWWGRWRRGVTVARRFLRFDYAGIDLSLALP